MSNARQQIEALVKDHKVVLFMKGTRAAPRCGFSARAVDLLERCGAEFHDVDVLASPTLRQAVKELSNWPTVPQAYIDGQFVGGSDLLADMHESGELERALGLAPPEDEGRLPSITLTAAAAAALEAAAKQAGDEVLRFEVSTSFRHDLFVAPARDDDVVIESTGIRLHLRPGSARRADGTSIDYTDGPEGLGFRIDNPNQPQDRDPGGS